MYGNTAYTKPTYLGPKSAHQPSNDRRCGTFIACTRGKIPYFETKRYSETRAAAYTSEIEISH